jgi:predicted N-acetyltransferase YhbS
VQYHVRSARLTDVDAAVRILMRGASDPGEQRDDADHLRSLLFLPAATVLVAESGRQLVGVGVLSIRPSVRPGPYVGVIDELGLAEPADGNDGPTHVGGSIIEQLIASARNKGCARVEVTDPLASAEPELMEHAGFERRGALLSRTTG